MSIIAHEEIEKILNNAKNKDKQTRKEIIAKAKNYKGLTPEEAATLFYIEDDEKEALFAAAKAVKERIYGKRVVLFAPLYTSDICDNDCLYCSFRAGNKNISRKILSIDEIVRAAKILEAAGHKRILLVCGESSTTSPNHIFDAVSAIYAQTDIRRINVNVAPLGVDGFKIIKRAGIGTYQLFQETYHEPTYKKMHTSGPKSDYTNRIVALDQAFEAGIDDLGIGILLGLYDYKYDVLASLLHAKYLETKYNVGPHTISIPRLRPAVGAALKEAPHKVDDNDLKKIVSIYRLAMPYTGIILSTRESESLRDELLDVGVSQISAGSKTNLLGYENNTDENGQFEISDKRSLDELVDSIVKKGYLPSFCTACYRTNRTGEAFMSLAKDGSIHEFCNPNSILTFKEYIEDHGKDDAYNDKIKNEIEKIDNTNLKKEIYNRLKKIEDGERDLYF